MKNIVVLIVLGLASYSIMTAQTLPQLEKINKIKLLESTRDDVKAILPNSQSVKMSSANYTESVFTDDSMIEVEYSKRDCNLKNTQSWNVPEGKVIRVTVVPGSFVKPADIKLNLSEYKMKSSHYTAFGERYPDKTYVNEEKGIKFVTYAGNILEIEFSPSAKYKELRCPLFPINISTKTTTDAPAKTEATTNENTSATLTTGKDPHRFFTSRTIRSAPENIPANVLNIILSTGELSNNCSNSEQLLNKPCSIDIVTVAKDPESDVLIYSYSISGGKITGSGRKVLWDLSGVKAGTYKITAAVDDGCGFCGTTITKTVIVK